MGLGWPRPRLQQPESDRPPGPRSCQLARYPMTTLRDRAGEIVAQGQRQSRELAAIHPVRSSTRASVGRDARRSHRSVEGDKKLCVERVETPILYKRVLLFSPIRSRPVWGGGGLVSDFEHHHHVVHLGLGRASWQGAQGLPPPFRRPLCPSCRVGFAPIPTKSVASRASGWILLSWERRRPGPAHRGQRRTRPPAAGTRSRPDTAEDCGSGVSNWARTPTGF